MLKGDVPVTFIKCFPRHSFIYSCHSVKCAYEVTLEIMLRRLLCCGCPVAVLDSVTRSVIRSRPWSLPEVAEVLLPPVRMSPTSPIDWIFTKHLVKGVLELVVKVLGMEACGKSADLSLG